MFWSVGTRGGELASSVPLTEARAIPKQFPPLSRKVAEGKGTTPLHQGPLAGCDQASSAPPRAQ